MIASVNFLYVYLCKATLKSTANGVAEQGCGITQDYSPNLRLLPRDKKWCEFSYHFIAVKTRVRPL